MTDNICIPCNIPKKKINLKCIHNKQKAFCIKCGGSQVCIHNIQKSICKDCKGNSICIHDKIKYKCKKCKGSSICDHNRIKSTCKECKDYKGSKICEHNRIKYECKECKGGSICIHDKIKSRCNDCNGSLFCEHNRKKSDCKECKGSSICEHNKRKETCRECNGTSFCKHNKWKSLCKICDGKRLCKSSWCEIIGIKKYKGYCLTCFIHLFPDEPNVRNYKTKENEVVFRIKETFPDFTWITDKKIEDGCSRRRPDLLLDMGTHIIIAEVDENKHTDYDCSCENKRLMEISQDIGHRPIVFIRFNPDGYTDENGIKIKSCWKLNKLGVMTISKKKEWNNRIEILKEQIQYWINYHTEKTVEIIQLFY